MASASKAELSRRLGAALGTHDVLPADRQIVQEAFAAATSWADLPVGVQHLVESIERSPATA